MKHILLADDDPDVLLGLRDHLEFLGYQVTTVSNGQDAVQAAQREDYSLLLMCSELVCDGVDVLRLMRQRKQTLPVILMTSTDDDRRVALSVDEVHGWLRHPVDRDELKAILERLLSEHG